MNASFYPIFNEYQTQYQLYSLCVQSFDFAIGN